MREPCVLAPLLTDTIYDRLLVSSPYEPISIVDFLEPYLAGSANLVVHSLFLEPLVTLQHHLKATNRWIGLTISEAVLRRYQVLPGRTHPEMQGIGPAGFLLHGTFVLNTDVASLPRHAKRRKTKKEDAEPKVNAIVQEEALASVES
jgi:tRNA (adenine-N(1)-)-methyltransferase non-catalytic subunit